MTTDARLAMIERKLDDRTPLSFDDGVWLYRLPDLCALGSLANRVRERMHGDRTYFNINFGSHACRELINGFKTTRATSSQNCGSVEGMERLTGTCAPRVLASTARTLPPQ